MANKTRVLIEIDGNNAKAINALDGVEKKLGSTENSILKMKNALVGLGAGFGIYQIARKAIDEFKAFDSGLRNINSIIGVSEKELRKYGEGLLSIKRNIGTATEDLTNAYYQAVSAGITAADSLEFLEVSAKAAKAGLAEMETAVDASTTVMNSFHLETDKANEVYDLMFQTVKLGKTTFSELAQNLSTVTSIAAASNIEFDQVSAAIASLTKQGIPTAQAVTQIRSAIIGMNETLGDGWAKTMTLQEGMVLMSEKAGGSSTKLQELVGRVEGMNAILAMTGDNAKIAASDLDAMTGSLGAMSTAYNEQTKSLQNRLEVLEGNVDALLIEIMGQLEPLISKVVTGLTNIVTGVENITDAWNKFAASEGGKLALKWIEGITLQTPDMIERKLTPDQINAVSNALGGVSNNLDTVAEDFSWLNENIRFAGEDGIVKIVDSVQKTNDEVKKTRTLTDAEIKAAEQLQKQWESTAQILQNQIITAGLDPQSVKLFNLVQSAEQLRQKYAGIAGATELINRNLEAQIAAQFAINSGAIIPQGMDIQQDSTTQINPVENPWEAQYEAQRQGIISVAETDIAMMAMREAANADFFNNMAGAANAFYQMSGQQSKEAFEVYKAFSIAQAGIATYEAAIQAYKSLVGIPIVGPGLAVAAAAAATAFGLARIAQISSMQPGSRGAGGVSGGRAPSIPSSTTYDNRSTTNNQQVQITVNISSGWQDPDDLARKLIPAINKAYGDGLG